MEDKKELGVIQDWFIVKTPKGRQLLGSLNNKNVRSSYLTYLDTRENTAETLLAVYTLGDRL